MDLVKISLESFRSYSKRDFAFEPQGSLIIGANGCGKTNLLEAIAYCGIGKSIRFHHDEELLRFEARFFRIVGEFGSEAGNLLQVALSFGEKRKLLKLDGIPIRQLSKLFDVVKVIYCAPDDLLLVNGSPRFRRQYFDLAISQLYPQYISVLRQYLHLVEQRNAMLKRSYQKAEKRSWDGSYAESLHEVWAYRKRYLELINTALGVQFNHIFPLSSEIAINYLPVLKLSMDSPVSEILQHL